MSPDPLRWTIDRPAPNPEAPSKDALRAPLRILRTIHPMSSTARGSTREVTWVGRFKRRLKRSLDPSRCHRRSVSGFNRLSASRQPGTSRASSTSSPRSCARNIGSLTDLAATISCRRSLAFSARSSARVRVASTMSQPTTPATRNALAREVLTSVTVAVTRD